jgi:hypothetical protein
VGVSGPAVEGCGIAGTGAGEGEDLRRLLTDA